MITLLFNFRLMKTHKDYAETTIESLLKDPEAQYTIQDYMTWRFEEMVELIRGRIFRMSPAPTSGHQLVSGALFSALYQFLNSKNCLVFHAPFDVYLPVKNLKSGKPDTVVQPDISVICDRSKISMRGCEGSPDWVIEILSEHTKKKDIQIKFDLYEECAIQEYWIVYPNDQIIEIFSLNSQGKYLRFGSYCEDDMFSPELFPELKISIEEVFAALKDVDGM